MHHFLHHREEQERCRLHYSFLTSHYRTITPKMFAALTLVVVPAIIVYCFAQEQVQESVGCMPELKVNKENEAMPVMNYRKGTEKEKSWIIEETSFNEKYTGKCESVFTQGNGYLGLRNSLEEQYVNTVRGMFITGTFNKASKDEVTELPNVSDIVNMEIELNGNVFP